VNPEGLLWLLDWSSNLLFSFRSWTIPPPFPILLHFRKALENLGEQEVLLDKRKMLLATWMVRDVGRGKREERLCATSSLILGEVF